VNAASTRRSCGVRVWRVRALGYSRRCRRRPRVPPPSPRRRVHEEANPHTGATVPRDQRGKGFVILRTATIVGLDCSPLSGRRALMSRAPRPSFRHVSPSGCGTVAREVDSACGIRSSARRVRHALARMCRSRAAGHRDAVRTGLQPSAAAAHYSRECRACLVFAHSATLFGFAFVGFFSCFCCVDRQRRAPRLPIVSVREQWNSSLVPGPRVPALQDRAHPRGCAFDEPDDSDRGHQRGAQSAPGCPQSGRNGV